MAALAFAHPAFADGELNPQRAAQIDRDLAKALKAVDQKHGDKKSSELGNEERRQIIAERAAAEREVFERHQVDAKAYLAYVARQNREQRAATKQAGEALDAAQKAAEAKAAEEAAKPKEIRIQRGGAGKDPIVLEEQEGAPPLVEQGLPEEALEEQSAAADAPATGKARNK